MSENKTENNDSENNDSENNDSENNDSENNDSENNVAGNNDAENNVANESPIVGIDLGTTNSVVAAVVAGQPQVLSEDDQQMLPSVVGLDAEGKLITGVVAMNQLAAFPDRTVASIKRKMGTTEKIELGDQSFTPQEVSGMILRRLRDRASRSLGTPVDRAVITVPAFFDENQRQATREAGELAGFKVERIINEPTAATLVYHAGTHDQKTIVVYDFGGGTFDVSIVRFEEGVVEVLSSKGDTRLGGDDIDQLLLDHVAVKFLEEHAIDLRENLSTRYRLLQACERAKCRLSEEASTEIVETFIAEKDGQPLNLQVEISREDFESLIIALVDRTIESVDGALRDAGLIIEQIDDLVLVGGSTRLPLVVKRLRQEFNRQPSRAVDPDLAVALGAATQAAMLDGQSVGPVLIDVTGHTLGLEVREGGEPFDSRLVFSPVIHRNSPLPAMYEETYSKVHEDQKIAEIHVLQGEHPEISRNVSIGKFKIDLDSGGDQLNQIVVGFNLTLDGLLVVTATQPGSGNTSELSIDNALSQFREGQREKVEARLGAMFDASDEILADTDLPEPKQWRELNAEKANQSAPADDVKSTSSGMSEEVLTNFPAAAALLDQVATADQALPTDDAEEVQSVSRQLKQAMIEGDQVQVASLSEELDDILFYVK